MSHHSVLLILCLFIFQLCCWSYRSPLPYYRPTIALNKKKGNFRLYDLKFDPKYFMPVSLQKPLGMTLVEVEENKKSGVFVEEVNEGGSAFQSGAIRKGLYLMEINGVDVKYEDFDTIMDLLIDAPAEKPLELVFIDPNLVMKGAATLTVTTIEGQTVEIPALKGQILRTVLQDAGLQVYKGKGRVGNCGGSGNCGFCVVSVTDNEFWDTPDYEKKKLKKYDNSARLSCGTIIEGDAAVVIQPEKIN